MPKSPTTSIPPRSLLQVITIIGLPFVTSGQPIWKCSNDSAGTPIIYGHVRSYIPLCLHTSKFEIERDEKRKKRKTGNKDRKKKLKRMLEFCFASPEGSIYHRGRWKERSDNDGEKNSNDNADTLMNLAPALPSVPSSSLV